MSFLILKDAHIDLNPDDYEIAVNHFGQELQLPTLLDEIKFELFMENINKKSLEQLQAFFK